MMKEKGGDGVFILWLDNDGVPSLMSRSRLDTSKKSDEI